MVKTDNFYINKANTENLKSSTGIQIKKVNDFKYLGSYVFSIEKYVKIRPAKIWSEINNIWKSNLANNLNIIFFQSHRRVGISI